MYIDSHAHIFSKYYSDINAIIENAKKNNVLKIINCATNSENFEETIELSKLYNFYFALGIHPEEIEKYNNESLCKLEKYILNNASNKYLIAIGEIGLDYYHNSNNKLEQIKVFEEQLILAQKYHLPVIIHSRDATKDTITILKKYKLKGVIHCFSGSLETAREYIKLGYKLGIGGLITFKNCNLKNLIKNIKLENIILETDCPFMTPEPYRKYINEPKYIPIVAQYISKLMNIDTIEVENITSKNCIDIFDFNR